MIKNKNQNGIALIETLLIILILVIIGFGGYYVWHTQKQTDKTLNQASSTSQKTVTTASKTPVSSVKYLKITEWGVRMPYTGSDTFTYAFNPAAGPDLIQVISKELSGKYGCTTEGAGTISRLKPTDTIDAAGDLTSLYAADHPHTLGYVKGYYYSFGHDQDACSDSVAPTVQNQANDAIKADVSKIQAIPQ